MLEVVDDGTQDEPKVSQPGPDPDAFAKIPPSWMVSAIIPFILAATVQSVRPTDRSMFTLQMAERLLAVFLSKDASRVIEDGVMPDKKDLISIEDWEKLNKRKLTKDDAEEIAPQVAWAYIKWEDLQYSEGEPRGTEDKQAQADRESNPIIPTVCIRPFTANFDTPPPQDSEHWPHFVSALRDYLWSRTIKIPTLNSQQEAQRDKRLGELNKLEKQPECIKGGTLMDFQMEGLNWLLNKWDNRRSCILGEHICSFHSARC